MGRSLCGGGGRAGAANVIFERVAKREGSSSDCVWSLGRERFNFWIRYLKKITKTLVIIQIQNIL